MTSPVTEKATKKNVWQMPESSKYLQRNLVLDNGHFLVQVLKKKWYSVPTRNLGSQKADILLSVQRLHCPGVFSRAKDIENCQYTSLQIIQQLNQFFCIIISANQRSIYGAVANICEEFETHQDGSGEPDVLMGQSIVLGEIKAEIPLQNETSSNHQILWQQYMERIESLE